MNFLPALPAWPFAVAGLGFALGPLVIHLLNRRRFRTVHWAAMPFLREALRRNRRILELRDLALLALRTLAVLLFGFALAQPFLTPESTFMWALVFPAILAGVLCLIIATALWSRAVLRWLSLTAALLAFVLAAGGFAAFSGRSATAENKHRGGPVHAVLLIDNSRSMSYRSLEGDLLTAAKKRAADFIEQLPVGSRVSVIPICGSRHGFSAEPYRAKEDALATLNRIEIVDRPATLERALDEAESALSAAPELDKRIVLFGDQQADNWRGFDEKSLAELPEMQIVDVSPPDWENTWISDVRLQDGLADVETPTMILVNVRHRGPADRNGVQVTLTVDGVTVASKTIDVPSGDSPREVAFEHRFASYSPSPGRPAYVPVTAMLTPGDRLEADDERHVVAPVVASLPVVFVDQYSDDRENSLAGRVGETKSLRRLLAPGGGGSAAAELIAVRHVSIDELDRDVLADARLVVIAGVADPGAAADLLREYVVQGGRLIIAAGGEFDPAAWTAAAWKDGAGILPAPLAPSPIGQTPDEAAGELAPFRIAYESLGSHHYFQLADNSEEDLRDLYAQAFFFKAVAPDVGDVTTAAIHQTVRRRWQRERGLLAALEGGPEENAQADREAAQRELDSLRPSWILFGSDLAEPEPSDLPLPEALARSRPRVLARFDDERRTPYLIERSLGRGRVVFSSSGLSSLWNTLYQGETKTIILFDRIARSLIRSTLPQRNFAVVDRLVLPIAGAEQRLSAELYRPGDETPEPADSGFIGSDRRGVTVEKPLAGGLYRVTFSSAEEEAAAAPPADLVFAVHGDESESDTSALSAAEFHRRAGPNLRWIGPGESISQFGARVRGEGAWWWLIVAVLAFLAVEMMILALSRLALRPA